MNDAKCLVEVDEVLNHLSQEDLEKIPKEVLKAVKEAKDKKYIWKYEEDKPLEKQNLQRKSIAILSYLNMTYLVTKEQRELLEELHAYNEKVVKNANS